MSTIENFEIVKETTIKFADGEICIATIKKDNALFIEATNSKECICRLEVTKKEVNKIQGLILDRLETYSDMHVAEFFLKRLSLMSTVEAQLVMMAEEKVLTAAKVGELVRKLSLKVKTKRGHLGDIKKRGKITIYVYSSSKENAFGRFFGSYLGDDFEFEKL